MGMGFAGTWWVGAGDVSNHPTMHRTDPVMNNYLTKNVNRVEVTNS
jgi:hypothetical protein